jgi:hypothetical protein
MDGTTVSVHPGGQNENERCILMDTPLVPYGQISPFRVGLLEGFLRRLDNDGGNLVRIRI